ncbi:MAG: cation transporter [Firmicutes bacterium]|nr:cation transporter [Bacillota bacterium]
MKKTYKMQNLDCANCAAKMETAIGKIDGVESCSISFMTQKMTLVADESRLDDILTAAQNAVKKVDRACKIIK